VSLVGKSPSAHPVLDPHAVTWLSAVVRPAPLTGGCCCRRTRTSRYWWSKRVRWCRTAGNHCQEPFRGIRPRI